MFYHFFLFQNVSVDLLNFLLIQLLQSLYLQKLFVLS